MHSSIDDCWLLTCHTIALFNTVQVGPHELNSLRKRTRFLNPCCLARLKPSHTGKVRVDIPSLPPVHPFSIDASCRQLYCCLRGINDGTAQYNLIKSPSAHSYWRLYCCLPSCSNVRLVRVLYGSIIAIVVTALHITTLQFRIFRNPGMEHRRQHCSEIEVCGEGPAARDVQFPT